MTFIQPFTDNAVHTKDEPHAMGAQCSNKNKVCYRGPRGMPGGKASEGELDCSLVISPRHVKIKEA